MLDLPPAFIVTKNKLHDDGSALVLVEINFSTDTLRLVRNTENITWNSEIWSAFPFEIDQIGEAKNGEASHIQIKVSNISRAVQAFIEEYDGGVDADVIIRVVHSKHLNEVLPLLRLDTKVINTSADSHFVSFTLGSIRIWNLRFPRNKIMKNYCRWRFKSSQCGYVGPENLCNKTLSQCRVYNNSPRFGGFPGVGISTGLKLGDVA